MYEYTICNRMHGVRTCYSQYDIHTLYIHIFYTQYDICAIRSTIYNILYASVYLAWYLGRSHLGATVLLRAPPARPTAATTAGQSATAAAAATTTAASQPATAAAAAGGGAGHQLSRPTGPDLPGHGAALTAGGQFWSFHGRHRAGAQWQRSATVSAARPGRPHRGAPPVWRSAHRARRHLLWAVQVVYTFLYRNKHLSYMKINAYRRG